jgi:hypothetical protein
MAEATTRTDDLPLYLGEADAPTADREAPDEPGRRPGLPHGLVAIGRAAHELSERLAVPAGVSSAPVAYETLRGVVIHITRHLVIAPKDAVAAFDDWLRSALATPVGTPQGSLRLGPAIAPGPSRLRAVPGRLGLRLSAVPLPVELELVAWGEWRTVLTLHPDRRFGWKVGPHRRSRYFAAGHATMDLIVHRMRTLAGDDGAPSYHGPACGPSSSTRTPVRTA